MNGMGRRTILLLALVAGLACTVLIYVFMNMAQAKATKAGEKVLVVTATRNLPPRTVIEPDMVTLSEKTVAELGGREAYRQVATVLNNVTLVEVAAGQALLYSQVAPKSADFGMSYVVPEGMRAVTVAVDPVIGVAGFLKQGDHVDVLATFTEGKGSVTKTVLQDVELLATGSQMQAPEANADGKPEKPVEVPNVTLSVRPEDAEKLILAESKGKLRLALRPVGEQSFAEVPGMTSVKLIGYVPQPADPNNRPGSAARITVAQSAPYRYQPPQLPFGLTSTPANRGVTAPAQVAPVEPQQTVEIFRGTDKEVVKVAK